MDNRAQVSLEYMIVLGISLVVLVSVLLVVNNMINAAGTTVSVSSAYAAMEGLREGADFIYVTGYPAKIRKSIFIPNNIVRADITGRMIKLRLEVASAIGSSYTDVYAITKGNVTGNICPGGCSEGNYLIVFDAIDPVYDRGDVNITLAS